MCQGHARNSWKQFCLRRNHYFNEKLNVKQQRFQRKKKMSRVFAEPDRALCDWSLCPVCLKNQLGASVSGDSLFVVEASVWITRLCPGGNVWNMLLERFKLLIWLGNTSSLLFQLSQTHPSLAGFGNFHHLSLESVTHPRTLTQEAMIYWGGMKGAVLTACPSQRGGLIRLYVFRDSKIIW